MKRFIPFVILLSCACCGIRLIANGKSQAVGPVSLAPKAVVHSTETHTVVIRAGGQGAVRCTAFQIPECRGALSWDISGSTASSCRKMNGWAVGFKHDDVVSVLTPFNAKSGLYNVNFTFPDRHTARGIVKIVR